MLCSGRPILGRSALSERVLLVDLVLLLLASRSISPHWNLSYNKVISAVLQYRLVDCWYSGMVFPGEINDHPPPPYAILIAIVFTWFLNHLQEGGFDLHSTFSVFMTKCGFGVFLEDPIDDGRPSQNLLILLFDFGCQNVLFEVIVGVVRIPIYSRASRRYRFSQTLPLTLLI